MYEQDTIDPGKVGNLTPFVVVVFVGGGCYFS